MRRVIAAIVLVFLMAAPAYAADKHTVRTLTGSWAVGTRAVHLELPPGRMTVEPSRDGRLVVDIDVLCDYRGRRCEERAHELALAARPRGTRLELAVDGVPSSRGGGMALQGRILAPAAATLTIRLGVGELDVRGHEGRLDVDLGVGEVRIRAPERALRFVEMNVGVGDGELVTTGGDVDTRGWLGKRVDWTGPGKSNLRVSVGVGEAKITLE